MSFSPTTRNVFQHDHSPLEASFPLREVLLRLWRVPALNRFLRAAAAYSPGAVRKLLERERFRVRQMDLRRRIRHRPRLVPEPELRHLLSRALKRLTERHGRQSLGDYLEFGVYNGTSLTATFRELEALGLSHVRLFGFDSFQGFPESAANEDEGRWQPGRCYAPLEFTTAVLESEGVDMSRVTLVPGWFSETLNESTCRSHRIDKASAIMIDCDLYSSTKEALEFCAPLIRDEAIVLFDEWTITRHPAKTLGEQKAFLEFLEEQRCFTALPFGKYAERSQAFMVSRH